MSRGPAAAAPHAAANHGGRGHVTFAPEPGHLAAAPAHHGTLLAHADAAAPNGRANGSSTPHITIPLSSVPLGSLEAGELPGFPNLALPTTTKAATSKAPKHNNHNNSFSGKTGKTEVGSVTSSTSASAWSRFVQRGEDVKLHVNHPQQVTQTPGVYRHVLAWVGRVGWCGKAVVYAMIGGLACQAAAFRHHEPAANLSVQDQISASPQGAFVLIGTTAGGIGIAILIVMMVALLSYILWRFWEGVAGQGYDKSFSSKKNFFKFRVSPIVSGAVYCSYLVFILELLHSEVQKLPDEPGKESWPATWRHSSLGRAGLAFLGLAFIIATCIQLQGVLTKQWHRDYRDDLPPRVMTAVFTIGHLGFAGRGGAFLAMAILFFKDAAGADDEAPHSSSMVANALQQLQANTGLRAVLMIIGILLILYGLFAVLSAWARVFPTPSPTRKKPLPASVLQQQEEELQQAKMQLDGAELQVQQTWGKAGDVEAPADSSEGDVAPAAGRDRDRDGRAQ